MVDSRDRLPSLEEVYGDTIIGEHPAYLGEVTPAMRKLDDLPTHTDLESKSETYWQRHRVALEAIKKKELDVVAFVTNHGRGFMIGAGTALAATALGIGAFVIHEHKKEE